jgi:hypothetical protein
MTMTDLDHEQLAELLAALPPAPEPWVLAAQALPRARAELSTQVEDLIARAEADRAFRDALMRDLETALTDAGVEPTRSLAAALRARLESGG